MIVVVADDNQLIGYPNSEFGCRLITPTASRSEGHTTPSTDWERSISRPTLATGRDPEVGSVNHAETGAGFGNGSPDAGQAAADQSQLRKASEERRVCALLLGGDGWQRDSRPVPSLTMTEHMSGSADEAITRHDGAPMAKRRHVLRRAAPRAE